jgi:general L-amino acid transport system permease protein
MSEESTRSYAPGTHPDLPPPRLSVGFIGWLRENLFSSWSNSILTILTVYLLFQFIPPVFDWLIGDAVVDADSRAQCWEKADQATGTRGACWAVITHRIQQFAFGFYPDEQRWRPILAFFLLFLAIYPVLFDDAKFRGKLLWFSASFPFIALELVFGFVFLSSVETHQIGGFLLTLMIGVPCILISLPMGVCLALGRRSNLPIIKTCCVMFIEFIRGVPLITLLFVADTMLNYFLPPGTEFDKLLRVQIMITMFSAAYIAEVVRGGLQAIPQGQYEAADAMGLTYWQGMRLVILPQAMKISIPGVVNTFIGLYKDTTLVYVIGMLDPLGISRPILSDTAWQGLSSEVYVFLALFYFVSCFAMSRYSIYLEQRLDTEYRS